MLWRTLLWRYTRVEPLGEPRNNIPLYTYRVLLAERLCYIAVFPQNTLLLAVHRVFRGNRNVPF